MRRLIISLGILALIIAMCIVNLRFVDGYVADTVEMIERACEYIEKGDYEKAKEKANELEKFWTKTELNLAFFVNDLKVAQVGEAIGKLPSLATKNAADDFLAHADSARVLLLHLYKAEQPSLPTVF